MLKIYRGRRDANPINVRALRPAVVMMMNYRRILDRLITRRWQNLDDDAGLSKPEKLWITLRYGLLQLRGF